MNLLKLTKKTSGGHQYGLFECVCGETREVRVADVKAGRTTLCKSCNKEKQREIGRQSAKRMLGNTYGAKHGDWGKPLYIRWCSMKRRCSSHPKYLKHNIKICEEWLNSYEQFKQDMEDSFFEHAQLDRIDNSKGYSKDNCQWLTISEHSEKSCKERWYG